MRECLEETGCVAQVHDVLGVFHGRDNPSSPVILIVYWAKITGGELKADDDVDEARLFKPHEIPKNLAFESTQVALARWQLLLSHRRKIERGRHGRGPLAETG